VLCSLISVISIFQLVLRAVSLRGSISLLLWREWRWAPRDLVSADNATYAKAA
jgi:hypothetical protein